jgi:hypothetical protein
MLGSACYGELGFLECRFLNIVMLGSRPMRYGIFFGGIGDTSQSSGLRV